MFVWLTTAIELAEHVRIDCRYTAFLLFRSILQPRTIQLVFQLPLKCECSTFYFVVIIIWVEMLMMHSSFTRPARRGMCAVCFCLFNRCDYFWHFFLCAKRVLLAFSLSSAGILGRNKSSVFLLLSQRMSHVCLLVSYIRCMHRICERYKYMKLSLCVSQGNRFPTSLEWLQKPTHT